MRRGVGIHVIARRSAMTNGTAALCGSVLRSTSTAAPLISAFPHRRHLATAEENGRPTNVLWDSDHAWQKKNAQTLTNVVTRAQLKALLANSSSDAVLLDLRSVGECKVEPGIPGATNIPADDLARSVALDESKWRARYGYAKPRPDTHLIVYSTPETKAKAVETATALSQHGYARVSVYEGGAREWNKFEHPTF